MWIWVFVFFNQKIHFFSSEKTRIPRHSYIKNELHFSEAMSRISEGINLNLDIN